MNDSPSPNGSNGGRFAPGNPGGPGNPHAKRVAQLRSLLLNAVSDEDLLAIATALINRAKAGDIAAIKELLSRLLGQPEAVDLVLRIEELESRVATKGAKR